MTNSGGIIAGGEGSRLRQSGITVTKPMAPVAGVPLIARTLRNMADAGIRRVVIVFNEACHGCGDWVQGQFPEIEFEILVRNTRSSFESFWLAGRALGAGRHLLSTVDCVGAPEDWRKMATVAADSPRDVFLGVTAHVHDDKPLRVQTRPGNATIIEMGGSRGDWVTAGLYNVSDAVFALDPVEEYPSLRAFLGRLLESFRVIAVPLADVIDVDTAEDLAEAERLLARIGGLA